MTDFRTPPMRQPDDPGAEPRAAGAFLAGLYTGVAATLFASALTIFILRMVAP